MEQREDNDFINELVWGISKDELPEVIQQPSNSDETDEISYFISDEYEQVEFVIGYGGVHLNSHRLIN
jgi:hypothetical protein